MSTFIIIIFRSHLLPNNYVTPCKWVHWYHISWRKSILRINGLWVRRSFNLCCCIMHVCSLASGSEDQSQIESKVTLFLSIMLKIWIKDAPFFSLQVKNYSSLNSRHKELQLLGSRAKNTKHWRNTAGQATSIEVVNRRHLGVRVLLHTFISTSRKN